MSYHEKDDELQRMRERRTGAPSRRRSAAPARNRTQSQWDEAYFEEEEYDGAPRAAASRTRGGQRESGRASRAASRPQTAPASRAVRSSGEGYERRRGEAAASAGGRERRRQKKRTFSLWKKLIPLALLAVVIYVGYQFLHRPTGYWNVAVFGVDSRDGGTDRALADVQMICSVNRATGEIRLVSVYRDTYLKINSEGSYHKINEAYFKGGPDQAVAALKENLDLEIDDYATFNWKAVADAINILGGIDLEISDSEFRYINAFITETVESTGVASVHLAQAGMNHLDGVQAVAYCRLRLMDTDFQRTERQRKVVNLALAKAKTADLKTLTSLVQAVVPQISTSIGIDDLLPLARDISRYQIGETGGFPFSRQTARVGKMDCVIPTTLESNVILLHQFLYGEEVSYHPSSAVKTISAAISAETGLYEEGAPAPTGGSSGSGGSGSSGGKTSAAQPAATPAASEETPSERAEEETEESTEELIEELEEETTEGEEETEEIGSGVSRETTAAEETRESQSGPGAEVGPGVSQENGSGGPGASQSSRPGTTAADHSAPGQTEDEKDEQTGPSVQSGPGM